LSNSPAIYNITLHYRLEDDAKACVLCYNISQALPLRVVGILNLAFVFVISRAFGNINEVSIEVKGGHRATKRQRLMPRLNWGDE
jgi:hypothetical protein